MENTEKVVYLDNAATTACAPEALAVMVEALSGACGNPSSHYSVGYEAKEFVDKGRAQVAKAINASTSEIFFTGCGSEADNWAVKGTAFTKARQNKKHLITSAFEHHAIMHSMAALERLGFEVTYIKPTTEGYIRPEDVEAAIRPDTALISIMMANNEIGTIQPIKEIAEIAHKHGVWMHTDAVQAVGAIPVDVKELGVDMLSMSAHKFNGPKGMGALYCRKGIWPQNLIDGGSQEARHRAGTENVAGIAGMGKALEMATEHLEERMAHEKELRDYVIDRILKNIPEARYAAPQHAQGIWAPAIRFQNGRFYIYYGMPDEGIYMVSTENPLGDWDTPVLVKPGKGLIDPCPFWDDDGRAYIIHGYAKSRIGFKSWLGIFPISPDGKTALGDDHLLYDGTKKHPTIEGPKVHKRGGWYYIFAPAGGVATGWQVCLRSRSISGPYETQVVLKQGSSETNGPHQGAWVETPEGEHWFLHFQSRGLYGRVTHLQPMAWQADGWPYIGIPDETPVPPDAIAVQSCPAAP